MKIALNSGAYTSRSLIANAQSCINLIPELNPEETSPPTPVTHFPRPGLTLFGDAPPLGNAVGRGVFTSSKGQLFYVVGQTVYYKGAGGNSVILGQIAPLSTPVSINDNGIDAVVVDGTPNGYTIDLGSYVFTPIVDGTGLFVGATRVDYSDTFLAFNAPGTNEWYISLSGQVAFNILNQANKSSTPDPISTLAFNLRQMWLLGTQYSSEVWFLSGAADFPYEEFPQTLVPYGCAAPYSLARADDKLFWISLNQQGQVIAVRTEGYGVVAISTRALEYEWSNYPTIADAVAYSYQQAGHTYVVFHFPTANTSWGYDLSTKQWHRRGWTDNDGALNRERVSFATLAYGNIIGQDWASGQLYIVDQNAFTDAGQPIVFERAFPHVVNEMKELTGASFVADFETGEVPGTGPDDPNPPQLGLAVSKDGGISFGNYRLKGFAAAGQYRSMMRWRGLGMGRDFVFKLQWSFNGKSALNGAFFDIIEHSA